MPRSRSTGSPRLVDSEMVLTRLSSFLVSTVGLALQTAQNEKETARLAPPRQLLRRATRGRSLVFSRKSSVSAGIRRTTATLNISKQANHDFS